MKNKEKYIDIFVKSLAIDKKKFSEKLKYNDIPEWDSMAHMTLVAEIDNSFNTMLDTEEILDMSSVKKAKEILSKYGAKF